MANFKIRKMRFSDLIGKLSSSSYGVGIDSSKEIDDVRQKIWSLKYDEIRQNVHEL